MLLWRVGPSDVPSALGFGRVRTPIRATAITAAASVPMPPARAQVRGASVKLAP
ncbi:hypothetical protein [Streptomyces sp. S3(2020)]|uniref:hypothetical protein n=1 Tax=Streptomyces sp. S3(2020) TaxID=2732044 RepID=UPI0014885BA4|nr:hypothetical protein [Streptomyces sp. S3(2020)]